MEVFVGGLVLVLIGVLTFGFLEIQEIREEARLAMKCIDSTDDMIDNQMTPAIKNNETSLDLVSTILNDQDKRINDMSKQIESISRSLLDKQDKSSVSIDEALNKLKVSRSKKTKSETKSSQRVLRTALTNSNSVKPSTRSRK